jgi:hypothetical protein
MGSVLKISVRSPQSSPLVLELQRRLCVFGGAERSARRCDANDVTAFPLPNNQHFHMKEAPGTGLVPATSQLQPLDLGLRIVIL